MSLAEVMATHTVWMACTFKPYVQLAFTYATYQSNGSGGEYGGEVDLRIRMEGDFFSDSAADFTLHGANVTAGALPDLTVGGATAGSNANFSTVSTYVPDAFDITANIANASTSYQYVDSNGIVIAAPNGAVTPDGTTLGYVNGAAGRVTASNWVRMVEFPGIALMLNTEFKVQQNEIDKYDRECLVIFNKIGVPQDKRASFNRLVGQDNGDKGRSLHSLGAASATGLLAGSASGLGLVAEDDCKYAHQVAGSALSGPQTPKASQGSIQMLVPLIFEWSLVKCCAIPSVSIPDSDRDVCVRLAPFSDIYKAAPGPIRIRETINYQAPLQTVIREHPFLIPDSPVVPANSGKISCSILVNNIFVDEVLHDVFLLRVGFVKYSCFRMWKSNLNSCEETKRITSLKFAVTEIYMLSVPKTNRTSDQAWQTWHLGAFPDVRTSWHSTPILLGGTAGAVGVTAVPTGPAVVGGSAAGSTIVVGGRYQRDALQFVKCFNTIDYATFTIQSCDYYERNTNLFYNSYLTFVYGGPRVVAPEHCDVIAFYWALHPGLQSPSGNYNASRAREAEVTITCGKDCDGLDTVGPVTINGSVVTREATLYLCAKAINFLLFAECSMVKHYV